MSEMASQVLRHTVFLTLKESVGGEELERLRLAVKEFSTNPAIKHLSYQFGPDLRLAPNQPTFVISADFASLEDYQAYAIHPDHLRLIEEEIKPRLGQPPVRAQFWASL